MRADCLGGFLAQPSTKDCAHVCLCSSPRSLSLQRPVHFSWSFASLGLFSNTKVALDGGMYTIFLLTISAEFVFCLLFPLLHDRFSERGY